MLPMPVLNSYLAIGGRFVAIAAGRDGTVIQRQALGDEQRRIETLVAGMRVGELQLIAVEHGRARWPRNPR